MKKFLIFLMILGTIVSYFTVSSFAATLGGEGDYDPNGWTSPDWGSSTPSEPEDKRDIPEGYRLLSEEDNDKTFGVDLEPYVFIDTSVTPIIMVDEGEISVTCLFNPYIEFSLLGDLIIGLEQDDYFNSIIYTTSDGWNKSAIETLHNKKLSLTVSKGSLDRDIENWNNWLYVKDINYVPPGETEPDEPSEPTVPAKPEDSITNTWSNVMSWITSSINGVEAIFYNNETEQFTFLGSLVVIGVSIGIVFLILLYVKDYLKLGN